MSQVKQQVSNLMMVELYNAKLADTENILTLQNINVSIAPANFSDADFAVPPALHALSVFQNILPMW